MEREAGVDCERVSQNDLAVAYLRGELAEQERDAFEQHFFECAGCFERLQVLRDVRGLLRSDARAAPAATATPGPSARPRPAAAWLAWAAGAAFVAVAAAVVLRNAAAPAVGPTGMPTATSPAATGPGLASPSPTASARPSLEELARVDPPPYAPLVLRGAEPREGAFERAMERYARGDHAAAAAGLRKAVTEDPASSEARFYLGVSELLAGRPPQAVRELSRVAAADDPEFAEAARYYLAKAHLAQRDVEGARAELRRLAQGDGAHKERAERLLQALRAEP